MATCGWPLGVVVRPSQEARHGGGAVLEVIEPRRVARFGHEVELGVRDPGHERVCRLGIGEHILPAPHEERRGYDAAQGLVCQEEPVEPVDRRHDAASRTDLVAHGVGVAKHGEIAIEVRLGDPAVLEFGPVAEPPEQHPDRSLVRRHRCGEAAHARDAHRAQRPWELRDRGTDRPAELHHPVDAVGRRCRRAQGDVPAERCRHEVGRWQLEGIKDVSDQRVRDLRQAGGVDTTRERLAETRARAVEDQAAKAGQPRCQACPARSARVRAVDEQSRTPTAELLDADVDIIALEMDPPLDRIDAERSP